MYRDETLDCLDCGAPFTFTCGEQEFFAVKGFANKPNRCPACRAARKGQRSNGDSSAYGGRRERQMFTATCNQCGGIASVPFQPRSDKPVYCRGCFASRQSYR
jgi:CxxC-x17-CxxC domain-containing protein